MMSEKEISTIKIHRPKFYTSLIIYWCALPILFVSYLLLKMTIEHTTFQQILTENNLLTVMFLIASLTPFSAYLLYRFPEEARSKDGLAGTFLKWILAQQLIVGNLVGVLFVYLTYREMPSTKGKESQAKWKKSSVYTLIGIQYMISFLAIYILRILIKNNG